MEVVCAEAGGVEDPQPVALWRHTVVGHEGAVDEDPVPGDAVGRRRQVVEGVGDLVVAIEGPLGDHQRDVAIAGRQRQRAVELVIDDPHPRQSAPDVFRGVVEAMVVVPLERGALRPAVLVKVVDVGFAPVRIEEEVVAGLLQRQAVRDVAEEGFRVRLGQTAGLAVELGAVVAAMQVDRQLSHLPRQPVVKGDLGAVTRGSPDRRARKGPAVGPHPRLLAGEDLQLGLADRHVDLGAVEHPRDRQAGPERNRPGPGRGRPPATSINFPA